MISIKKVFFIFTAFLMFSSVFLGRNITRAMAEEQAVAVSHKYYTSITIEEGETLWTIADRYSAGAGMDTSEYLRELKAMNNLTDDTIYAGCHLTVAYYSEEQLP